MCPRRRIHRPCAFQSTGDRVRTFARAVAVFPAETLLFNACAFRFNTHIALWPSGTVCLTKGMTAGNQRHSLFVVHRHAAERFANILRRCERVRIAVWALWVYVDQAHLHGAQPIFKLTFTFIALVCKPLALRAPVHFLRLP